MVALAAADGKSPITPVDVFLPRSEQEKREKRERRLRVDEKALLRFSRKRTPIVARFVCERGSGESPTRSGPSWILAHHRGPRSVAFRRAFHDTPRMSTIAMVGLAFSVAIL